MAENFKINVGKTFTIDDHYDKMQTGGQVYTQTMRLSYHDGDGISFTANEVLYTEGAIGGPNDFFEITSYNDVILDNSGYLSVLVTSQTNVPSGAVVTKTISVGGSLPFNMTISYS